jgi:hypothetical protein
VHFSVKKVYFCGEKTIWLQHWLEKNTTNAHEKRYRHARAFTGFKHGGTLFIS